MEGGAAACSSSCSPENVFRDFRGRRAAIIKALTTDFDKFYQLCDPEKENLCLYGHPDGTWEVRFPAEKVPTELPEPASGINFPRDGMDLEDWVPVIADYSDSWLLAVAFYYAARFGFDKKSRMKLFNKINFVPTVYNATRKWRRQTKKKTPDNSCGACGESYGTNEFLILCSVCKRLFHGKCVKIASIEQINQYTCSDCSSDKLGTNKS